MTRFKFVLFILFALLVVALPVFAQDAEPVERTSILSAEAYGLLMTALALIIVTIAFGIQIFQTRDLVKSFTGFVSSLTSNEALTTDLEKRYMGLPEPTKMIVDTLIAAGDLAAGLTAIQADDKLVAWMKTVTDGMPNVAVVPPAPPPTEETVTHG